MAQNVMNMRIWNEYNQDITEGNPWIILEEGFSPIREREVETLLSFGNGYIGTRNSLEEHYEPCDPSTFIAGIYRKSNGSEYDELAKVPDWTRIQVFVEGNIINLTGENNKILSHKRYLDLKRGLVFRELISQDKCGRITNIKITKFISLSSKHEAFKSIAVSPVNYTGRIRVISGIDGKHSENIIPIPEADEIGEIIALGMEPKETNKLIIISQISEFLRDQQKIPTTPTIKTSLTPLIKDEIVYQQKFENQINYEEWEWVAEYSRQYTINSLVTVFSGLNQESTIKISREYMTDLLEKGKDFYKNTQISHLQSWNKHWKNSDLSIFGDSYAQKCSNYAIYHLINSGEFSGNDTSIPARNLSGEAYRGHIFWDTEIYMLPFYIFTDPDAAKALLIYRYNTLDGARENAKKEGRTGASYAWESTDSGIEATPKHAISPFGQVINIYSGEHEIHISADIAYAVWQYWLATLDEEFLVNYGSEIIFETARFSIATLKKDNNGNYHICNVVGPDEYHELVDDNAFTNFMIIHNLEIALKVNKFLNEKYNDNYEKLKKKIGLNEEEIINWNTIKDKIYVNQDSKTKIYEQFKGYFDLKYVDLKTYEPRTAPMDVIIGREETRKSQIIKQPDVLMALFLLSRKFSQDIVERNYNFYEPRTSHGSSLSPGIHSILAARLGKTEQAYKYFKQSTEVDLNNNMGNAAGGIHMATMGSIWMSIIMGFAGMHIYENGLLFDPHLPDHWKGIKFSVFWHGQKVNVELDKEEISFEIIGKQSIEISIGFDNWKVIEPNNTYFAYKTIKWYWK